MSMYSLQLARPDPSQDMRLRARELHTADNKCLFRTVMIHKLDEALGPRRGFLRDLCEGIHN
jgi:hypothetical protein